MPKRSIFIGSAGESKELATKIAQALSSSYAVRRWWEEFPSGSITLDRLAEIAKQVDGAVLLCAGVDTTTSRQKRSKSPRDNVILEYGMFVAELGRHRCMLLHDAEAKLPSDVAGITNARITDDWATVGETVLDHFNQTFKTAPPLNGTAMSIVADPAILQRFHEETLPQSWHQRALYFGIEGAKRWIKLTQEMSYLGPGELAINDSMIIDGLREIEPRTVVSLGVGTGRIDLEIAKHLHARDRWVKHIPVDISDGLLHYSLTRLAEHVRVPVGILGDMEDRMSFIDHQLRLHATRPALFCLLGGTIGNLDTSSEEALVNSIRCAMDPGDYLMIEVTIIGKNWSFKADRRTNHDNFGKAYKEFICAGVSCRTGEPLGEIVDDFKNRVSFEPGTSRVPGAQTICYRDVKAGRDITRVRRYDWQKFLKWLEGMGFFIASQSQHVADETMGFGVVVAKAIDHLNQK